ncbi:uncharacterized protein TNCV_4271661 [Trichonephila clavipes]|nr:uncharacterized protein TNCV_4271661 [Trichonephila clavipes]
MRLEKERQLVEEEHKMRMKAEQKCLQEERCKIMEEQNQLLNEEQEKSDEDMELPQAIEKVLAFKSEHAYMLSVDPDVVAQPVAVGKEKGLSGDSFITPLKSAEDEIDEAHFWLIGYVNKENCRIWSEASPQVYVETPLHPEKLTVWCALWAGGIIGPYFFKNDEGHNELWFQQDGATCHTARATIDLLKDMFGDRLISRFGPVNWLPRSCDLHR